MANRLLPSQFAPFVSGLLFLTSPSLHWQQISAFRSEDISMFVMQQFFHLWSSCCGLISGGCHVVQIDTYQDGRGLSAFSYCPKMKLRWIQLLRLRSFLKFSLHSAQGFTLTTWQLQLSHYSLTCGNWGETDLKTNEPMISVAWTDKQQLSPAVPHGSSLVHVPHQRAVLKFCHWSSDLQREQSPVTGGSVQRMANALLLMARRLLEVCGHDEVTVCRQPGDCWHKYREGTRFEASDTTGKNEIGIILAWQSAASNKSLPVFQK